MFSKQISIIRKQNENKKSFIVDFSSNTPKVRFQRTMNVTMMMTKNMRKLC